VGPVWYSFNYLFAGASKFVPFLLLKSAQILTDSKPVISYQSSNLKPIHADYIYHKNEKSKPGEMDLPLLKNDITGSEPTVKVLDT
jgi:hypothetical protein